MSDPVEIVESLGGRFAPNLGDYAMGLIGAHQIQCLLCESAPCQCGPCPACSWTRAPGKRCQACG